MRAYIITSGLIFLLITVSHIVRLGMESTRALHEPIFIVFTLISAALSIWAVLVLRRATR